MEQLRAILRENHIQVTQQRLEVLRVLKELNTHLTVDNVRAALQERQICLTTATVYNILNLFEKKGLITKTPQECHGKRISLWATAEGKQLTKLHIKYDNDHTAEFFRPISEHYTSEQLDAFFKIMEACLCLLRSENETT